ncbi:MAG: S9 family peptidase [Candidatus Omnitrophica bacterium]|nr:S9 family peptidase [Candidatus Omnitrophota bacterium]
MILLFLALSSSAEVERREQGALVIEGIPEIPEEIVDQMYRYRSVRTAIIEDWAADGEGMLISTRFGETYQLHWVAQPAGMRRQLTFFQEPVRGASIQPDPEKETFIYSMDEGGGEFYQIHEYDLESGKHRLLTDGKSRNGGATWSNKGDRFAYYSTARNGQDWDLYVMDPDSPEDPRRVLEEGGSWVVSDWSPDDKKLLVVKYVSANESHPHVLDLESGELTEINPTEEKIAYGGGVWAKDGKGIYFTSDQGAEFQHLRYWDLEKKEFETLTGDIPWDIESIELSDDGKTLAFTANEDGIGVLYLLNTKTGERKKVPDLPLGQVYGLNFHPDNQRLAIVLNTPQTPGDIYVLNISDNSLTRWTYSEVGGLPTDEFVIPELIHYPTFDELDGKPREIPAFLFKPNKAAEKYPVVVYIHGGPESQFIPYFSSNFQYYLRELGIAVVAPNVRGSAGYGKSYLKLDNGYQREDSVKDIGALLDWIEEQPDLDSERVAVMGGSYGGYMVLASLFHYPDRIKAGIDSVGISNFVTFLENTQDYRRDLRRVEYGDERDPEMRDFLQKISPTNNADKIRGALFVAQGLNDPRVPASEAEQMVEAIRGNGGTAWYLLAKDEGHGFSKKTNADYYYNAVALFLEKHLLD